MFIARNEVNKVRRLKMMVMKRLKRIVILRKVVQVISDRRQLLLKSRSIEAL